MRKFYCALSAGFLFVSIFSGCSDDNFETDSSITTIGNTVNFALSETPDSRTVYDESNTYQINWENDDQVRIFCYEAEDVTDASYTVAKSLENEHTGTLTANTNGLKWGSNNTHKFYAIYGNLNNVSVDNQGIATFPLNLNQMCELPTSPDADGNYKGTPDMDLNAYMVAYTETTPTDQVSLTFKPIMTTLQVKVRARQTMNTQAVTLTGISIINNNVLSSDANQGRFRYNIATGQLTGNNNTSPTTETTFVRVRHGANSYIDLTPGQSVTLTVFLPPLPINGENQITLQVHATGETTQSLTLGGNTDSAGNTFAINASAKANITLPYFPEEQNGNLWMTPLDDNIYVSQLSIPGTHDAATMYCDLSSGRCQTRSITEQLNMGIRCFDLRPAAGAGYSSDNLPIKHGAADCNITLQDVYDEFNTFLNNNPGEFIITIIRWEREGDSHVISRDKQFNSRMNTFVSSQRYTMHALPRNLCNKDLTVGEARGHILNIMRPNQGSNPDAYFNSTAPAGMMFISGFPGSHATGTQQAYLKTQYVNYGSDQWGSRTDWIVYCQNYYQVNNESTESECVLAKINSVKRYLDLSKEEAFNGTHVWTINHCSGYLGGTALSSAYARLGQEVNLPIYNYLIDETRTPGSTGIVLLDYVGDRTCRDYTNYTVYGDLLPQTIIDNNYKYRMLRRGE